MMSPLKGRPPSGPAKIPRRGFFGVGVLCLAFMIEHTAHGRRAIGVLLTGVILAGMLLGAADHVSAGGAREREITADQTPQRATGPLSGEVVTVTTLDDGTLELTTVYVEIPAPLARSFRVLNGDLIRTTEHEMARDGERLRVQTVTIDRNR